ncbi:MAG: hypothetical protein IKJ80_01285 [Clostridia bacterium]|nr:hypothetical protein [Clostridia bacterium]
MKKTLSIVIAIAMIAAMLLPMSIFASAEVTEITNWQDLVLLVTDSFGEGNYKLTADVYCDQPIEGFFGTFDGNGHTIYLSATMFMDVGGGAVIKNFTTVQDPNAAATDAEGNPVEFKMYRAPIIDLASGSSEDMPIIVENVTNNVDVFETTSFNQDPVAGIIGRTDSDNYVVLNKIVNNGDMRSDDQTGGIIGNAGHASGTLYIHAANVVNNGEVYSTKNYAGGIIGNSNAGLEGILDYCFNNGNVTAENDAGGIIGDINGIANVTISNCVAKGTITNNPVIDSEGNKLAGSDKTSAKYGASGIVARSNEASSVINIKNCVVATTLVGDSNATEKASTDPFNGYANGGLVTVTDSVYLHGMAVYGDQAITATTNTGFTTTDQVAIDAKINELLTAKENAVADTFAPPASDPVVDDTTVDAGDDTTKPAGDDTTKPAGDNTTKPADTTKPTATTTAAAEEGGCGSSISLAIVAAVAVGAVAIARKKED